MPLSKGEIAARAAGYKPHSPETWRAWEYWANRAGCGDMIGEPHAHAPKHDHAPKTVMHYRSLGFHRHCFRHSPFVESCRNFGLGNSMWANLATLP